MALTESQKLDIAMILGVTYLAVDEQVTWVDDRLTSEVESKIVSELDRWTTAGAKFTRIKAMGENFGADIDPSREKLDIQKRLAGLLYFTDLNFGAGNGWGVGARG